MLVIGVISLFVCGCFVTVNTHPKSDSDEEKCLWNNEEFIRSSFERTCSQQLLIEVKNVADSTFDRLNQVDNASRILQQELTGVREIVASSMTGVARRQNGIQKTLTEVKVALRSCGYTNDEVTDRVSHVLQEMSESQKNLKHDLYQTFEDFTEKLLNGNKGLQGRMSEVTEAQERSTRNIISDLDELREHLQQGFEHASTQRLLMQVKESVDNISAMQLTRSESPASSPTCTDVDEKQQLVSALTSKNLSINVVQGAYV